MILVTGAAGFIGYHVAARLLADGERVVGVDNLNSYYDPALKRARLAALAESEHFAFARLDIADRGSMEELFASTRPALVIHLAAQAGVRHSIDDPHAYTESNVTGFLNVLEGCRQAGAAHLIYASSSSVYGGNRKMPFSVGDPVDTPVSLYAATKRANELMAHCYAHLYGFAATGLRFFTVYGPWGRPDMAPYKFARAIALGGCIDVHNYGHMRRDFTYIDDIVEGVARVSAQPGDAHRLFNIGSDRPVELMEFISALEKAFGRRARKRFLPMPAGDVVATHADIEDFCRFTGFRPATPLETGVAHFVDWYQGYYGPLGDYRLADDQRKHEYGTHHSIPPGNAAHGNTAHGNGGDLGCPLFRAS